MNHLHLSYEQVMNTPISTVSLLVSESVPRYTKPKPKDGDTVELETYSGKVKAKRKFII